MSPTSYQAAPPRVIYTTPLAALPQLPPLQAPTEAQMLLQKAILENSRLLLDFRPEGHFDYAVMQKPRPVSSPHRRAASNQVLEVLVLLSGRSTCHLRIPTFHLRKHI